MLVASATLATTGSAASATPSPRSGAAPAAEVAAPAGGWATVSPDEAFLDAAAGDLLDRDLTDAETASLAARLARWAPRRPVARDLALSDDGVGTAVADLYPRYVGRGAGDADRAFWGARLASTERIAALVVDLLSSPEVFRQAGGDPAGYVDLLYERALGRPADGPGRAWWVAVLDGGARRSTVVRQLVGTPESRGQRVDGLYATLLRRPADAAGRRYWVASLARTDDLELKVTLTASREYFARATADLDLASNWTVERPEDHGMDPGALDLARRYAFSDPDFNTQGVVVVRDGVIVSEWYAPGRTSDSWAASWSVAKSFATAMIGIAIADGDIAGVDEPMTTWIPEWEGTAREGMTLRDVLTMASGLQWNEDYNPSAGTDSDIVNMIVARDQLAYALGRPQDVRPGTRWSYSSGDTMLLSRVIEAATGMPADEYARTRIYEPLGMDRAESWSDAEGHGLTYCCVDTTSRGFARFGQLYLQGGEWEGRQIVPSDWVADSVTPTPLADWYGYMWWLDTVEGHDVFRANGFDGQTISVVPDLDLVVVRNGTYDKWAGPPVADPNLFSRYPPAGYVEGLGTKPSGGFDDRRLLAEVIASIDR